MANLMVHLLPFPVHSILVGLDSRLPFHLPETIIDDCVPAAECSSSEMEAEKGVARLRTTYHAHPLNLFLSVLSASMAAPGSPPPVAFLWMHAKVSTPFNKSKSIPETRWHR